METLTPASPEPARAPRPAQTDNGGVEFWRVERVARLLDVSRKRVYRLVQEKKLDAIRLTPRNMRILRASLERYLAGCPPVDPDEEGLADDE